MKYYRIEYEFPFMRAIYTEDRRARSERSARSLFMIEHPKAVIRKVTIPEQEPEELTVLT